MSRRPSSRPLVPRARAVRPDRPLPLAWLGLLALLAAPALAQDRAVYRCPGNLYTDQISVKEAAERGCKTLEGAPVTVIQTRRPEAPRAASGAAPAAASATASTRPPGETRIDPAEQKARDTDARRILEGELRKEEERLAALQKEAGSPADERGQPRSAERTAELKAAIARKEADVAAIRRELGKLGAP